MASICCTLSFIHVHSRYNVYIFTNPLAIYPFGILVDQNGKSRIDSYEEIRTKDHKKVGYSACIARFCYHAQLNSLRPEKYHFKNFRKLYRSQKWACAYHSTFKVYVEKQGILEC